MPRVKQTATQKLRKNVLQQIRRMENRGYRFEGDIRAKIKGAKYQTLKSLQKNRYQKLYKESTALQDDAIVSGEERRKQERREAAQKAADTRRSREQDWEEARRKQDEIDRQRAEQISEGEVIYDNIVQLINEYPTKGSLALKESLAREIAKYGKENVMRGLANAPEQAISLAQQIVFYESKSSAIHSSIESFFDMITGTIRTTEEAKEIGDTLDDMTDEEYE